jgi:hypothetical protein
MRGQQRPSPPAGAVPHPHRCSLSPLHRYQVFEHSDALLLAADDIAKPFWEESAMKRPALRLFANDANRLPETSDKLIPHEAVWYIIALRATGPVIAAAINPHCRVAPMNGPGSVGAAVRVTPASLAGVSKSTPISLVVAAYRLCGPAL